MQPHVSTTRRPTRSGGFKKLKASKTFYHRDQCGLDGLAEERPPMSEAPKDKELEEITAGLTKTQAAKVIRYLETPRPFDGLPWSTEETFDLCVILLEDLQRIANPAITIGDFFDLVGWVLSDRHLDDRPFSLKHCLKVVNGFAYRDSFPDARFGQFNVDTFREQFRIDLKPMWGRILARQHPLVQKCIAKNLNKVVGFLLINPQWANEEVKRSECGEPSLFDELDEPTASDVQETANVIVQAVSGGDS